MLAIYLMVIIMITKWKTGPCPKPPRHHFHHQYHLGWVHYIDMNMYIEKLYLHSSSFRRENSTPPRKPVSNITTTQKLMLQILTEIKISIKELQAQMSKVLESQQPNQNIDLPDVLTILAMNKEALDQLEVALEKPEF